VALTAADGLVLAEPLVTRTDLPAFPTSSVDGWAVRGPGPWQVVGQVLAGATAPPLAVDGTCVEIATGAMVPSGTTAVLRLEDGTVGPDTRVAGQPRGRPDWREPGEEAAAGEELAPAGVPVTPALVGLAASCGYDALAVRPRPRAQVLVFGDELLAAGLPGAGRVRDALGPQVPAWLRRLGADVDETAASPVVDTLAAHVDALRAALDKGADLICTTGGTMRGPVDHLHPALARLDASYVVDAVAVRPGSPMLLATVAAPGGRTAYVAGLPGNPQSAVVALVSLVAPLLAAWSGRPRSGVDSYPRVRLAAPVPGRGRDTHLALVHLDSDGVAHPLPHAGSAMLRGLARSVGFAVVAPGTDARPGDLVPLVPLPLLPGEVP
jgi:molybdopterin molybdotransferase